MTPQEGETAIDVLSGRRGYPELWKGLKEVYGPENEPGILTRGATDILKGAGTAATPLMIAGALAQPELAALAGVGSVAGGYGAKKIAEAVKASPDTQALVEQVGQLAGGLAGGVAYGGLRSAVNPEDALTDLLWKRGYIRDAQHQPISFASEAEARYAAQEILRQNPGGIVSSAARKGGAARAASGLPQVAPEEAARRAGSTAQARYANQQAASHADDVVADMSKLPRAQLAEYMEKSASPDKPLGDPEKAKAMWMADREAAQTTPPAPREGPSEIPAPTPAVAQPAGVPPPPVQEFRADEVEEAKPGVESANGSRSATTQTRGVVSTSTAPSTTGAGEVTPGLAAVPGEAGSPRPLARTSEASASRSGGPQSLAAVAAETPAVAASAPAAFAKGDRVTLPDGRSGQIKYVSPPGKSPVVTVTVEGKTERFVGAKAVAGLKAVESGNARVPSQSEPAGRNEQLAQSVPASERESVAAEVPRPGEAARSAEGVSAEPVYKYGSTQANIPEDSPAAQALTTARARISKDDLAGDGIDVGGNHVTVRYGIKSDDVEGVRKYLASLPPFEASLGSTEIFPPSEHSDGAAVVHAPIEAPELHAINAELEKHGDFIDPTFDEYKPHATVAYVKPDRAHRYLAMNVTKGQKFPVSEIAITDRQGKQQVVKLEGKVSPTAAAVASSGGSDTSTRSRSDVSRGSDSDVDERREFAAHEVEEAPAVATRRPKEEIDRDIDALTAKATERQKAAKDESIRALRPAAVDWMSEDELQKLHTLQLERHPYTAEEMSPELARQRVEVKRAARAVSAAPEPTRTERERQTLGLPPEPGRVGEMNVRDLKVAPNKFQYKLSTDAEGVGTLLKETKVWNPDLAGIISVWRDPADGKTYVVNGHHRYELAKRLGVKAVTVRHVVAPTAKAARAIGAEQNIADGRGTAMDAGKFFRDSGITADDLKEKGIPLTEGMVAKGMALGNLSEPIFNRVVQGDLTQGRAIAIGEATADAAEQKAVLDLVERKERTGKKVSDDTLSELIRLVKGSGQTTETTANLFGTQEINRSLALEKAEISAHIKQQLSRDKKLFGFVAKESRASELARAGNKIDVEKSKEISTGAAQAEEVYNRLSERGGPIASILDEAARQLADGGNAQSVKSEAYARVRAEVSKTLGGGEVGGTRRSEGTSEGSESARQSSQPDDSVAPRTEARLGSPTQSDLRRRRSSPPASEPTLPGMENVPAERAEARAEQTGRDLTEKLTAPPTSIESRAGEIEQKSPLFRETAANPQSGLFAANSQPSTSEDFVTRFNADRQGMVARYLERNTTTDGQVAISADRARYLFPEYAASKEGAFDNTVATNRAASLIASAAFDKALAGGAVKGKEAVFVAGMPGSGKSTAENAFVTGKPDVGLFYEGNLSDADLLQRRVKAVIDAGGKPTVVYVYAPPATALRRMIARSQKIGRYVPIAYGAAVASNTPASIEALYAKYGDEVRFAAIDNSGKPEDAQVSYGIDSIRRTAENRSQDEIRDEQTALAESLRRTGELSEELYQRIGASSPTGADRPGNAGEHQETSSSSLTEKPPSLLKDESGSLNPSLRAAKSVYAKFINSIIDQNLDLGDKYKRVAEHDPAIASMLKEKDNAPRYFHDKAESNVAQVTRGLNESQVRLTAMMADSDAREFLEENHPEQFQEAQDDPAVMAAVGKFKQYQDELAAIRISLGWHVRRDLSSIENEDGTWSVVDRDGNEVGDPFDSQRDAQEFVEESGNLLDHLKRTYPEHLREPLMGRTDEGPSLGASYGGIKPPRPDKKQRLATAEYFYTHGAKDFSGYVKSFTQAYHAALNQKIYDSLTDEATKWKEGTAQPPQIEYRGKTYYSPDVAKSMKLAKPENRPKQILEYRAYDPAKDDKLLIRDFENHWSTMTTGRPGISPSDRYLAPKDVVDALENYDATRGVKENDSIRRFFQDQIVGLFGPSVHVLNIMRRLATTVGSGAWDPRVWPYYQKLFFSKELRERMAEGLADDAIDALSKWGTYTNAKDIGSLHNYALGNMDPRNWARWTIGKFSKGVLFDPKFLGGFGGLDQKARVLAYDFLRDREGWSEEETAKNVEDGFGNYNKANWTERMKRWARVLLFPGWDLSTVKWVLRHPIKTTLPALAMLGANLAINKAGKNRDSDKYDFAYLHYGDRKYRTGLVTEPMAMHLVEPILEAGKAALEGGGARDIATAAGQGVLRGGGGLAGDLRPDIQLATDLLSNRQYMGGEKEIWRPEDANIPGTWLPTRKLEKMAIFTAVKVLPSVSRFLDTSYESVDLATGAGSVIGVTNYKSGAEERLRANEAKAMGYSQTLSALAEREPEAAEKFVQDPAKAPYLLFNKDFSELGSDLKKLATEIERVKIADMPYADRKRALEDLRTSRTQLLQSADALDEELTRAKLQMKKAVGQ